MTLARGSRPAALVLAVLSLAALATPALAAPEPDRTDSPYFVVPNADPGVDALPLLETRADIAISGVIAHVRVTQVYKNDGKKPLEAIYVFPGSTRSAVFAMKMKIGEREIVAEIQKKDDARKMYEDAKREGRTASLLEQQRPNVFQMNVANILPGDRVNVVMDYAELLVPDNGTYELVYPAVVGPRYTGESQNNEGWTATPHLTEGKQDPHQQGRRRHQGLRPPVPARRQDHRDRRPVAAARRQGPEVRGLLPRHGAAPGGGAKG
jgi:Ca-activated chloride channel family protein